jgi:glutamine amidotransferase
MVEVAVIDYGVGNLLSVSRALVHCGAKAIVTADPATILAADRVILPGVGAFANGMAALRERGLDVVVRQVAAAGTPLLGICLGMQMMATSSVEFVEHEGLNLIAGRVLPLSNRSIEGDVLKIPSIGWHSLTPSADIDWVGSPLGGLIEGDSVYLVHSYHIVLDRQTDLLAHYDHGGHAVTAAIRRGLVFGCQFHPEKSGEAGLRILRSFISR